MDLNHDHLTTAAGGGLLGAALSALLFVFRGGQRWQRVLDWQENHDRYDKEFERRIEGALEALGDQLRIYNEGAAAEHRNLAERVNEAKESARRAHERIDGLNTGR